METAMRDKMGRLFYQVIDEKPVAGIFVLVDQTTVYALFSGIGANFRKQVNNELVHLHVLKHPDFAGMTFDFLGANTQDFEQFKRSFGGELVTFYKVRYTKNKFVSAMLKLREFYHLRKRDLS